MYTQYSKKRKIFWYGETEREKDSCEPSLGVVHKYFENDKSMNLSSRAKITNEKSRPTARHCATTRNEAPRCCQGKPDRSRLAPTSWTLERCTLRPFFPLLLLSARTEGTTISTSSLIRPDEICVLPSFPLPLPRFVSCCRWPFFAAVSLLSFFSLKHTHTSTNMFSLCRKHCYLHAFHGGWWATLKRCRKLISKARKSRRIPSNISIAVHILGRNRLRGRKMTHPAAGCCFTHVHTYRYTPGQTVG